MESFKLHRKPGDWQVVVAVLIVGTVVVFFGWVTPASLARAREGSADHLIDYLEQAAKSYELDHGEFPPGDGSGSRELVECLERKGPKGVAYVDFSPDIKIRGHIANPVWYDRLPPVNIIYYRNNRTCPARPGQPPVMNKNGFDLWTTDAKDRPWGVNNWDLP